MTATVKKSVKSAATKSVGVPVEKKSISVCVKKEKDDLTMRNVLDVATIKAEEVNTADNVKEALCLNMMAGRVDPAITEAHAVRGRLAKLFPNMPNAELNALRKCLDAKPEILVAGWAEFAAEAKRIRGVSIQALAKAIAEPGEKKLTLKDALTTWCEENPKALTARTFPVGLFDILTKFGVVETEADDIDE